MPNERRSSVAPFPQAAASAARGPEVTWLLSKDLPEFPGKEISLMRVVYPPGGAVPVHRHDAHGFMYVLEGSVVMQVKGGQLRTLTPGDTFYEGPGDVHVIGRNASETEKAVFVAFWVKDKGAPIATRLDDVSDRRDPRPVRLR